MCPGWEGTKYVSEMKGSRITSSTNKHKMRLFIYIFNSLNRIYPKIGLK